MDIRELIGCFHKSHLFCENMGSFFVLCSFFLLRLLMAVPLYFLNRNHPQIMIFIYSFCLCYLREPIPYYCYPCCAVVLYTPDISLKYLISRMPCIYYHRSISRLSYYTNIEQVCGWWETLLAAHSHFFNRLFRCTILWGTLSVLYDRKG